MSDIELPRRGPGRPRVMREPQRIDQRINIRTPMNRFDIDESKIPAGMTYEWRVETVMGMEAEESKINDEANGWTYVPSERHPELSGKNAKSGQPIIRGGLALKERPKELTDEAKRLDNKAAQDQVSHQFEHLGLQAKAARALAPEVGKAMRRERSLVEIPDDD